MPVWMGRTVRWLHKAMQIIHTSCDQERRKVTGTRVEQARRKASVSSKCAMHCALTEHLPYERRLIKKQSALLQRHCSRAVAAHNLPTSSQPLCLTHPTLTSDRCAHGMHSSWHAPRGSQHSAHPAINTVC